MASNSISITIKLDTKPARQAVNRLWYAALRMGGAAPLTALGEVYGPKPLAQVRRP